MPEGSRLELLLSREAEFESTRQARIHRTGIRPTAHPLTELWEATVLRRQLQRLGVELFHAPAFRAPFLGRIPTVTTIHDLAAQVMPETIPLKFRIYLRASIRGAMRRSRLVLCPSDAVRKELEARYPNAAARVEVVPWGTPPLPELSATEAAGRRARLGLPEHYLLAVGADDPRKNIGTVLEAMKQLASRRPEAAPNLVVCGGTANGAAAGAPHVDRKADASYIRRVGYLDSWDLSAVYRSADALIYPSLYEGFGLPILEAMSVSVPVVTSRRGAMLEVAGEAGVFIDPTSAQELADATDHLLRNTALREELAEKGRRRAGMFRWSDTARRTWSLYEEALRQPGRGPDRS